jgi:PEGA domain
MHQARRLLVFVLSVALIALAQGNTFDRVRYNGGTVATKVSPKDWDNKLTVTSDLITFALKDGQKVEINPKLVTGLSYGQEAHRRVGTMVALGILVAPVALFGLFHKTRLHYTGIEYNTAEGKKAGLLLQGDKSNYRAILVALQGATGVPVAVSEEDRKFIPVGVTSTVASTAPSAKNPQPQTGASSKEAAPTGTVTVTCSPDGADVYADGAFVGNAPATLKLSPGKHTIRLSKSGYQDWSREISVLLGSELKLNAVLEKGK